jgi:DNA-binding MarR family transcriptional regulator
MGSDRLVLDRHVVDVLMPDLVGHDHQPSAFIVYLYLWSRKSRGGRAVAASLQQIASDTGLSKSAVQQALRRLRRRRLVASRQATATSVPEHLVLRPWAG